MKLDSPVIFGGEHRKNTIIKEQEDLVANAVRIVELVIALVNDRTEFEQLIERSVN